MLRIELHESESSLEEISKDYAGYVAADLAALVRSFMTPMTTVVISNKEDVTSLRLLSLRVLEGVNIFLLEIFTNRMSTLFFCTIVLVSYHILTC